MSPAVLNNGLNDAATYLTALDEDSIRRRWRKRLVAWSTSMQMPVEIIGPLSPFALKRMPIGLVTVSVTKTYAESDKQ